MTDYKVYNRLLSDKEADAAEEDFKVLDDEIETFVLDSETPASEIFRLCFFTRRIRRLRFK